MTQTITNVLATCVLRWIYEQASAVLRMLKAFIEAMIAYIDLQLMWLRAQLAQWDMLARTEEALWQQFEAILNALKEEMNGMPKGPGADVCPEFYNYFLNPAKDLFEASLTTLNAYRHSYKGMLSYMDEIDQLIAYWTATKIMLEAILIVVDDALAAALMREAKKVP